MSGPIQARPSASVIIVRDAPRGLETFMVRRHSRSRVAPDAYVFPGGTVRSDDVGPATDRRDRLAESLSSRSDQPVDQTAAAGLYTCAIRELFEEAGVLLVRTIDGELLRVDATDTARQERWAATRLALQACELTLVTVLNQGPWRPAFDLLTPFSHWVTPASLAARFDTWFFVAAMPPHQEALHDTIETSEGAWLRPSSVLEGGYQTVYATAQHLHRLVPFSTVADLVAFAARKPIRRVQPELIEGRTGIEVRVPPDVGESW